MQKDLVNIVNTYASLHCPDASFKETTDIFNTVPAAPLGMTALQTSLSLGLGVRAAIVGSVCIGNFVFKTVLDEDDNVLASVIPDYSVTIDKVSCGQLRSCTPLLLVCSWYLLECATPGEQTVGLFVAALRNGSAKRKGSGP